MLNVNLNGIDTLLLDFDGANTAVITAPGVTKISHTGVDTGITELTGDVTAGPGSGSQVTTLSNTSTARSHLGLGTMATQNANTVAVTGGTVDGTAIGSTTPSSVKATTFTGTSINLDDSQGYPANSSNLQGFSGMLFTDSTGPNASTFGAFSFRGVKAGNPGGTGFTPFLSSDNLGNWTIPAGLTVNNVVAAKSVVLASSGGGSVTFQDGTVQSTKAVSPTLQTNGTNNTVQNKLNLVAGANVTLTADGSGDVTIASSSGASANHFTNTGATPTGTVGTAAGSGTIGIQGGDAAGSLVVTAGTGATAGTVCTVTFATPYTGTATVLISPAGFTAQQLSGNCASIVTSGGNAVGFEILCQGSMVNGTGYQWNYMVMGMP